MKKWIIPLSSACFLTLLCLYPEEALRSAASSFYTWATAVAPSLLPYLIVCPALTSPEISAFIARFTGGFLRFMRLPSTSSGALMIGLLSGSPAGAAALSATQPDPSAPPGAYLRAGLIASGASPAFLLSGIAVSMLDCPETGWLLLRSQYLSLLLSGLLHRRFGSGVRPDSSSSSQAEHGVILKSILTLLTIGGYMAFFAVLARLLALLLGPSFEMPLLAVLELAGGCRALSLLPAPLEYLLPLISAAACFGGISVYAQCMSFLKPLGVHPIEYAAGKLFQAALCAALTWFQLTFPWNFIDFPTASLALTGALSVGYLLFSAIRKRKTHMTSL